MDIGSPDTELDSSGDCLVCLNPCTSVSSDLFVYNCKCVYHIHNACFKEWRRVANHDRICMICDIALDEFSDDERPVPNPGIDHRIDTFVHRCQTHMITKISITVLWITTVAYTLLYCYGFAKYLRLA